jgi:hypothetical protein
MKLKEKKKSALFISPSGNRRALKNIEALKKCSSPGAPVPLGLSLFSL